VEAWFADDTAEPDGVEWLANGIFQGDADVNRDGSFRLDGLVPGRWKIKLHARGLLSQVEIMVPGGREIVVTMEPRRGALLLFKNLSPLPRGDVCIQVSEADGGTWWAFDRSAVGEDGFFQIEVTAQPGRLHWRLFHFPSDRGRTLSRQGSVNAVAAQQQIVEIVLTDR